MASAQAVVVLVTCPTAAVARRLSRALVTGRLAACVTVVGGVTSTYRWQRKVERSREQLLLIKTTRARVEPLRKAILKLHPYRVPEIIALPIVKGHPPYLRWVAQSVRS
jgi:periplasmic divalent cation tolerance protein